MGMQTPVSEEDRPKAHCTFAGGFQDILHVHEAHAPQLQGGRAHVRGYPGLCAASARVATPNPPLETCDMNAYIWPGGLEVPIAAFLQTLPFW